MKNNMDKPTMTHYRWWVMSFIFVIYTVANADRANIGFALPFIQEEFNISNTLAGLLISLFFAGYALFQIPAGYVIKKYGMRNAFALGMFLTSIFTALMGVVNNVLVLKLLRFFVGVSEAPVVIGSTATINQWFPAKEKGTATGLFLAGSKFGPLIVPALCAWIIMTWGWRYIFVFFAIPGVLLSIFWYFMVRNKPEESRFVNKQEAAYIRDELPGNTPQHGEAPQKARFRYCWLDTLIRTRQVEELTTSKQVFRCWDIYGVALGYFSMVGIVSVLMSWLPKYLITERGFDLTSSAALAAAPFLGTVLGNFLGGVLSDRVLNKRRKPLMLLSAGATIFTMYSLVFAPESKAILSLMLFMLGLMLSLGYSAYSVYAMGRVSKEIYPVAYSVINMGGQLGGMCMPLIVGVILDRWNWDAVFMTMTGFCVLCFMLVATVIEPLSKEVTVVRR
ncbi:MFS transporter [Kosakonia radicincitans]|uniref:MFS transporter n=1 Tax=Kosakonia radicincitans TaxID=283686 RepID=UPI000903C1E6|nr:MFS transporter [Kosakonia radicincitans]APG18055.1 MFS transporter [Kosakonia radicincitans]